eukprot:342708-Hanusia_phi.AAC.2
MTVTEHLQDKLVDSVVDLQGGDPRNFDGVHEEGKIIIVAEVIQDVSYVKELNLQEEAEDMETGQAQQDQSDVQMIDSDLSPVNDMTNSTNILSLDNSKEHSHRIHRLRGGDVVTGMTSVL